MTYVGTLQQNRKGLPAAFKSVEGRADGDYFILYDITGKKSIHSWLNQKKSGEYIPIFLLPPFSLQHEMQVFKFFGFALNIGI